MRDFWHGEPAMFPLGRSIYDPNETVSLPYRRYSFIIAEAMPRYGKGGVTKPVAVRASLLRRLCVFDVRGEWSAHITRPNLKSRTPLYVSKYRIYQGFTFKLSDFGYERDWISMGFDESSARLLAKLFKDTKHYHKGIPKRFLEVVKDLPYSEKPKDRHSPSPLWLFNTKYRTQLFAVYNWQMIQSWALHLDTVLTWFWQGSEDTRPVYNFVEEWLREEHIFIDLSSGANASFRWLRNRTFCGKILEQMYPSLSRLQGQFVFEEADYFFPAWPARKLRPSSNTMMKSIVAKAPKDLVSVMLIVQNESQLDAEIITGGQWQRLRGMTEGKDYKLKYYPDSNYREFEIVDVNKRSMKFVPAEPCCAFESNIIKGGSA